jgi:hypothetical protein
MKIPATSIRDEPVRIQAHSNVGRRRHPRHHGRYKSYLWLQTVYIGGR